MVYANLACLQMSESCTHLTFIFNSENFTFVPFEIFFLQLKKVSEQLELYRQD